MPNEVPVSPKCLDEFTARASMSKLAEMGETRRLYGHLCLCEVFDDTGDDDDLNDMLEQGLTQTSGEQVEAVPQEEAPVQPAQAEGPQIEVETINAQPEHTGEGVPDPASVPLPAGPDDDLVDYTDNENDDASGHRRGKRGGSIQCDDIL